MSTVTVTVPKSMVPALIEAMDVMVGVHRGEVRDQAASDVAVDCAAALLCDALDARDALTDATAPF